MRNLVAIAWKEVRTYIASPIAYIVAAAFLVITGYFFASSLNGPFPEASIRGFVSPGGFVLVFLSPLLTMRLVAEEQKLGTIELLLTAPVRDYQVIIGKYLASLAILAGMLALTFYYPLLLFWFGQPDPGPMASGYLGILLLGAALLSVGVLTSTLTSNQIVAAVLAFGILLLLWIIEAAAGFVQGVSSTLIEYLSLSGHYDDFARGIVDTSHVVYYVSIVVVFLFLATVSLGSRRWR